ncbi:mercuric ion transporter MerT [Methylocystis sp. FS]|uniref:mercuric ion transporter MerT n=1 Tax=Methylocystis TaxID=133 RepID=UPI0015838735|nr:mercuric ion transporter MerT [Methylocystis silviterrae]MCQ4189831.1 mercuric ion transporter MerT [Methylocystis suflitae]NUJ81315.1 mercuric ion transporter MerT [Methylocystis silviterrae]
MSNQIASDRLEPDQAAADQAVGRKALAAGGVAAILASACCLGPLVLVSLGFSGAWLGNFKAFEPFRPLFLSAAFVALFFAWRRIYRPVVACKSGEACAAPQVRSAYKVIFWGVAALIGGSTVFPYVLPLFY